MSFVRIDDSKPNAYVDIHIEDRDTLLVRLPNTIERKGPLQPNAR